ncbi:hypothetical protein CAL29_02815 [Bordetella genomosp. 10]|uniref:Radical SAM core domain-containing protein n=1 Tax=Bordetella genomosp. 10 TaxID=1416804 RepID=A0A261SIY3_9BORD|nr:radical SAM protein [Bordetella genomosp. 10]OZI37366.1 hypothetical protein CAL29_02815 [Bordetella genomosp. 10]
MRHIEIILKVAERCNLNCKYCYFFNKGNKDFENHPPLISAETVQSLVKFLRTLPQKISETAFQLDMHGGEPLLLGPKRFAEIVSIIKTGLHDAKQVRFTVQTNAVLINEAWLEVFSRHQISVGISIDGSKAQHDANRIDHRGRGTFDSMVPKIAAVKQAFSEGRIPSFGSLCVVSPESNASTTYMCLTKELGFSRMQFLFPDETHDSASPTDTARFVKFVGDLFECWERDENKKNRINIIDLTLQGILQKKEKASKDRLIASTSDTVVFTVSSGGDIGHDDTLRNAAPEIFNSGMNVKSATFPEFLAWHSMVSSICAPRSIPSSCARCTWLNVCGHVTRDETPLHRMKNGNADQPSIYCEALKAMYLKSAAYLAKRGVPLHEISKNLHSSDSL